MKGNIFTLFLLIIFFLDAAEAFSQFNPLTNSYSKMEGGATVPGSKPDNLINYSLVSGVGCVDNSFWAIKSSGIDQFTLINDTIKKIGTTVISGAFDQNLAYCNNLNGGAFTPTFYATKNYNQPAYFDSTKFINTADSSPDRLINCGGSRNFLYYISYDSSYKAKAIVRYTGSALIPIYTFRNAVTATVGDLAIDSTGNIFFFTGPNNGTLITDTISVISPTGHLLEQVPFPYHTLNAYGSFLLHGKLYVGLGPTNPNHPNTVLPITITAVSASAGTPISMPVTTVYADMASCSAGSPFSVNEHKGLTGIVVYPNPVIDLLTINSNSGETLEIILYDFTSKELLHQSFTHSVTVNTGYLIKGIYLYKIWNKAGAEQTGIVVKQ